PESVAGRLYARSNRGGLCQETQNPPRFAGPPSVRTSRGRSSHRRSWSLDYLWARSTPLTGGSTRRQTKDECDGICSRLCTSGRDAVRFLAVLGPLFTAERRSFGWELRFAQLPASSL